MGVCHSRPESVFALRGRDGESEGLEGIKSQELDATAIVEALAETASGVLEHFDLNHLASIAWAFATVDQ